MGTDSAKLKILDILVGMDLVTITQKKDLIDGTVKDIEFSGLGIDSMAVIDLCVGLEEQIGREVAVEELIEHPSVNTLADHLSATDGNTA